MGNLPPGENGGVGRSANTEPHLEAVREAPSQSVKHLGLGTFMLVEATGTDGSPARAVVRAAVGHERVVTRVALDDRLVAAIETTPEVKVARCAALGEPSSAYIRCEAVVLPPDRRKSSEFMLTLSFGFVQRLANKLKGGDYAVIEMKPIKAPAPAPPPPASPPPLPPASPSEAA